MVAFRNGFELAHQVGELLDVPSADIAENPLAFLALFARSLPVFMRVIVVARGSMAQPWEAGYSLTFRQHVAGHAGLTCGEGISQQVALQFGDARPILHIEVLFRCGYL